ncbi:MAG: hypothetical protein QF605_03145 [Rhodospirillales bacterium]|nr:hypothetical protein [Rhodospirillales bacterium]
MTSSEEMRFFHAFLHGRDEFLLKSRFCPDFRCFAGDQVVK